MAQSLWGSVSPAVPENPLGKRRRVWEGRKWGWKIRQAFLLLNIFHKYAWADGLITIDLSKPYVTDIFGLKLCIICCFLFHAWTDCSRKTLKLIIYCIISIWCYLYLPVICYVMYIFNMQFCQLKHFETFTDIFVLPHFTIIKQACRNKLYIFSKCKVSACIINSTLVKPELT